MARRTRIGVERLESRLTPATATLTAGTLTILGDGGDRINVFLDRSQLVVTDKGLELGRFANAAVGLISIVGGNGSNIIHIAPNVSQQATIVGGVGPDDLIAGRGPTTLDGRLGTNDKLSGGPGNDTLLGGPGTDVLIGRGSADVLDGGPGSDKLVQVEAIDTVIPDPADQMSFAVNPAAVGGLADPPDVTDAATIAAAQVQQLLDRASAATPSRDAIIAIVDRNGRILGVRVEDGVSPLITGNAAKLTFAIDGAVAEARTGAFFGNAQAPLTSRTIEFISQSTITEREVNSDPSVTDVTSTLRGPGYVAPVGIRAHFPPNVPNTPQVDLFQIEGTNRDTTAAPGPDGIIGTADDIPLAQRFNIDPAFVPPGQTLFAPFSYGRASGIQPNAEARGIGTLPGGIPIYLPDANGNPAVVGGIGVFFPGKTGYASEENSSLSTTYDPTKPDRSLEAEYIAFAALGGTPALGFGVGALGGLPPVPGVTIPLGPGARIDLVGITLDIIGPGGSEGPSRLFEYGKALGQGAVNGANQKVTTGGATLIDGLPTPVGWLVAPHAGVGVTAQDVVNIVSSGIAQANLTRAAIRLPLDSRTRMIFAVTDRTGNILGLFRMEDATVFSIDVAVAKARNVAYYADPTQLQTIDNAGAPAGTAFTNRTFRYLAEPRFPEGIDGDLPGVFSILTDGGADFQTGRQIGPALPASAYFRSVGGHDAFFPGTNFHDPFNLANQNGIVFFPGSVPLYRDLPGGAAGELIGGFGVSGDGVDQDDVVTFGGSFNYGVPLSTLRADQVTVSGVRLPYQKFNRNPED